MIEIVLMLATSGVGSVPVVPGDRVRVAAHDPSLLAGLAHGDATDEAPGFTHFVDITCASLDDPVFLAVADALRSAEDVDLTRSAVVAGSEFVVIPGDEQILLAMALTRRDDLTPSAYLEHWSVTHAALARTVPGLEGYRQVHRDDTLTATARATLGVGGPEFDGVALCCYSSKQRFESILADADTASMLLADERRFIDHSRAAMVVGARSA